MPKISAPTVAEHHAAQHAALLRSAVEILTTEGLAAATPRAVCERAGLSRTSFYDYFPSRDDLLVAVAVDAFESWDREVEQAIAPVPPGPEQLATYVTTTLRMAGDGRHQLAGVLREAQLSPSRMDGLMALHDALLRPLVEVLGGLGAADPQRTAGYVQGMIGAGIQGVEHGADPDAVAADIIALLTSGVAGLKP